MIYASGNKNLHTLQYKLMEYLQASQTQQRTASDAAAAAASTSTMVTPVSIRAAITVIAAAPILFIYPFMQRYFIHGLNVGGVKE
jgi:putative aldouronate transport system permease protein